MNWCQNRYFLAWNFPDTFVLIKKYQKRPVKIFSNIILSEIQSNTQKFYQLALGKKTSHVSAFG